MGGNSINGKELLQMWGGYTYPCQPNPEKSGCRSLGLRLPEIEWSYVPNILHYPCQYWGLPAVRGGLCMSGWGLRTCDFDDQHENLCRIWWLGQCRVKLCHPARGHLSQMSEFDPDEASLGGVVFLTQLGHGPLPVWPAWLTVARQQTSPKGPRC